MYTENAYRRIIYKLLKSAYVVQFKAKPRKSSNPIVITPCCWASLCLKASVNLCILTHKTMNWSTDISRLLIGSLIEIKN